MKRASLVTTTLTVVSPLMIVAAWWWWTTSHDSFFFPALPEVLSAFREDWVFDRVGSDLFATLRRFVVGYSLAVVIGVAVGTVLGLNRTVARTVWPVVEFVRAIPPVALLPFTIVAIGVNERGKVFLIVIGAVWPVLLNAIDGVRGVDAGMLDAARAFGAGRRDVLTSVRLPAALPQIMAGMRSALSIALILTVISELVATSEGVGFFIVQQQRSFQMPEMWGGMLMLGFLGIALNTAFSAVERRVLRWYLLRAELQGAS